MTKSFSEMNSVECLRQECESLLTQVRFHQQQIKELPRQAIMEMMGELCFPAEGVTVATISIDDIEDYLEKRYGN